MSKKIRKPAEPKLDLFGFAALQSKAMAAVAKVDRNDFNTQIATALEIMGFSQGVPKGSKPIFLNEIVASAGNGVPGLSHENGCNCYMIPTTAGDWYCDHCKGHVKKVDAGPMLMEAKKKWEEKYPEIVRRRNNKE